MRKIVALAVCGMLVAPLAFAQTNVLSQNSVGYVKVSIDGGKLELVSQDFVDIDGDPQSPSTVVGDQMPIGSRLFVWNAGAGAYDIENYLAGKKTDPAGWSPDAASLEPGVGFFLEAAGSSEVFLLGEVPSDATTDLFKPEALESFGFPYPSSVAWTGTAMAADAEVGDRLFTWDQAGGVYNIANYLAGKKSDPAAWNNPGDTIEPGQGFFYENNTASSTGTVSEVKPYDWP